MRAFFSLKRANGAFQGAFSDSVEKVKSCPIIGGGFERLPDVSRVRLPKSFAGGLFSQLAKGLYERIREKPLYEESVLFVRRAAGTLPRRPK